MGWLCLPSKAGCRPTEPELLDGLCRYCLPQTAPPKAQHPGRRARGPSPQARANNLDTLTELQSPQPDARAPDAHPQPATGPISSIGRYCVVKVAGDTPC